MCDVLPSRCAPVDTLIALVQSLSDAELCELIAQLPLRSLRILEREFLAPPCDCPVLPAENLVQVFNVRCPHTLDHGQWVMPPAALDLLCSRLPDYAEPPPPETWSNALEQTAKVGVYAHRQRAGLGLRHPRDPHAEQVDDVGRDMACKDHGSGRGRLIIGEPQAATVES
jgi:hypothetical protein